MMMSGFQQDAPPAENFSCRDWIKPTKARTKRHEQRPVSDSFSWSCPKRISSHRACGSVGKRRVGLITLGASPRGCADRDAAAGDGHKVINARRAPVPSGTCPHIHRLPWPTHGRASCCQSSRAEAAQSARVTAPVGPSGSNRTSFPDFRLVAMPVTQSDRTPCRWTKLPRQ
jgi:hypothetical protein